VLDYFREIWSTLDRAVAGGTATASVSDDLTRRPDLARAFALGMHHYALFRGQDFVQSLDLAGCTALLDVGCGSGTYAFELGRRYPDLALFLLDRPAMLDTAREIEQMLGVRNQVTYLPQDALTAPLHGTYDAVLISNMLQMLGERAARQLLERIGQAVVPGGSIIVQAQFQTGAPGGYVRGIRPRRGSDSRGRRQ
jgi:SAM-dependent methyltransferase